MVEIPSLHWPRGVSLGGIFSHATGAIQPVAREDVEANIPSSQRLFASPGVGERCDHEFVRSYEQTFGGSRHGAQRHFALLQRMPPGHRFAGIVSADPIVLLPLLLRDPFLTVGARGQMFNRFGEPLELENVALAHFIPQAKKPVQITFLPAFE